MNAANKFNQQVSAAIEEVLGAVERNETNVELIVGLMEIHKSNIIQMRQVLALRKQKPGIVAAQSIPSNLPKIQ